MRTRVIIVVILGIAAVHPALARETTGHLEGRVLDREGLPVAQASILVSRAAEQRERNATSARDGHFRIMSIPVGEYTVRVSLAGYQDLVLQQVMIRLGATTSIGDLILESRTFGLEEIVVLGHRPPIDAGSTEIRGNLSDSELESLPTTRDYNQTIAFLPQINVSFLGDGTNIAGATGAENTFNIDGVNVSDPYLGIQTTRLPTNFIREIEVKTGGYQAEFARALGGVVNVITHTGSNEHAGQIYTYLANSDFAADGRRGSIELEQDDFTRHDAGFSAGGPIVRDNLFYFVAYDPNYEIENLRLPVHGAYRDIRTTQQFAGKLTWYAGASTMIDVVVFGDPSEHQRVGANWLGQLPAGVANPDPMLGRWEQGGTTYAVNAQHIMGDNVVVDIDVSRFHTRRKAEPLTETGQNEQMFIDETTGIWSGGYQHIFDFRSTRTAARVVSSLNLGRHKVKAGLEFEDNELTSYWTWATPDGQDGVIIKNGDTDYLGLYLDVDNEVHSYVPSVFLQDSWRVTDHLRINAGLRWDGYYARQASGERIFDIEDQYQPRLGFTYQLGAAGQSKVFGSFGRYYEQIAGFIPGLGGPFTQYIRFYDADPRSGADPYFELDWSSEGGLNKLDDLVGQHSDEFVLGFEGRLGSQWVVGVKGIYRELRAALEDVWHPPGATEPVLGNPGRGELDYFPEPKREYQALQFELATVEKRGRYHLAASYVISRNYGNYPGTFDSDTGIPNPHGGSTYDHPYLLENATGLLPNDRTHVLKLYGAYRLASWFDVGGFVTWQSGTPLSEFGYHPDGWPFYVHLRQRGTYGRSPAIWDANLRFAFAVPMTRASGRTAGPRLILDIFHLFSQRTPVAYDQQHYLGVDEEGNQINENPSFNRPLRYQPPMTIRVGFETRF